ncbi:MFS transporter [Methylobacterium soli]|uniref:MFS transporter n=1 Tax=Methylobacterium soli TaxID=553447 RepID=A0A6L3SRL0_9HYPH|nr:MFS transporter [Methylobacterium soli]KAB1069649.1 MFS transporter [Methylobacterium soli]GJE44123.1 Putative niacin/nicotinamide transporter NaiP [Methylobacterium soli]
MVGEFAVPIGGVLPETVTEAGSARASDVMIAARLERLPMTQFQRNIFLIIATAWFFDSIDLGSLTFLLGSIKTEFGLTTAQAGLLSSMSFVGMFLGAGISGMLADRFGRKVVFQVSMIFWGLGSLWCAYAPDATTLGYARLLLGFGMGMEFPVALAIVSEFLPTAKRGRYLAIMEGFWPLGFIAAGCLSYVLLSYFDWRAVFLAQAVPAVFLFAIRFFVPESPRWLADRGRHAEADRVMEEIEAKVSARLDGRPLPEPQPLPAQARGERRFSFLELWSPGYASRTVMIWLTWFFALLGFYGLTTWLGALLQEAGHSVTKSVVYTILISLAGVPGFITSAILVERWGRKPTAVLMLLGSAVAAYLYGHSPSFGWLIAFGLMMQFFLFGMWSVLYAYTPELYPTRARATGAGCASAIGRVGSLIGPYAIGIILPTMGHGGVFALGAGSFVIAAMSVAFLGIETKGRSLEAISH